MDVIKEWVDTFRADVETVKRIVADNSVNAEARKLAAAALNYLVSRLDLVPDHHETIGVIDDVLVLRVCLGLASAYGLQDSVKGDVLVHVGRLINDVEQVEGYLGRELYPTLRRYCAQLPGVVVRGRSPATIVNDAEARSRLFDEIDDDLLRMPAATFEDPDDVDVKLRAYLHHKLRS